MVEEDGMSESQTGVQSMNTVNDEFDERRTELLSLPDELRAEVLSYYEGGMDSVGFAQRIRSMAHELKRHADAIEERAEEADACPSCGATGFGWDSERSGFNRFEAKKTDVYRDGPNGNVFFSVEFDCPECGAALIVEDAHGTGPHTDT